MAALKRKAERTEIITLRIPAAVKAEIDRLRPLANAQGFDVNASLVDAIVRCTKQIAEELNSYTERVQLKPNSAAAEAPAEFINGGSK